MWEQTNKDYNLNPSILNCCNNILFDLLNNIGKHEVARLALVTESKWKGLRMNSELTLFNILLEIVVT